MRGCRLFVVTAVAAGVAWPASGLAQVTPEEAQEIETGFKAWLSENIMVPDAEVSIVFDGGVEVMPDGDRYMMTIPAATISVEDEVEFVVDTIPVELVPAGEGRYNATWTMPDRYEFTEPYGSDTVVITVGAQRNVALVAPEFQTFLDADIEWNDVVLLPPDDEGELSLGALRLFGESDETAPGVFDSTYELSFEGLNFLDNRSGDTFTLESFGVAGGMEQLNLPAYMAFFEELTAIIEAGETMQPGGEAELMQRMQTLISGTPALLDSFSLEYFVAGLDADIEGEAVVLGEASLGVDFFGMSGDASDLTIFFQANTVDIAPPPPFAQYIPTEVAVEMGLAQIPNEAIIEALSQAIQNMPQMGPEGAMMMAGFALQEAMMSMGSEVQVREFNIIAPTYTVSVEGSASPSQSSPFGAIAQATILVGNLDQLQQELMAMPETQEPAQMIAVFQAMGQEDVDVQGNPARRFDIEVTEAGSVTLNGADMAPLLQQMQ